MGAGQVGLGRLTLKLHSDGEGVAGSEIRDRVDILVAVARYVQIPNAVAHQPVFDKIDSLLLFVFDNPVNRLMRKREDESGFVPLIASRLDLPVLSFLETPRNHGVASKDFSLVALDDG